MKENSNEQASLPLYDNSFVSNELPSKDDELESEYIEHILHNDFNLYENKEDTVKREEVLHKLDTIVKKVIYSLAIAKGKTEEEAREAGGKIFTFGSYRLGVVGPGDDIDVLCVGPDHADRNEFFDAMDAHLKNEKEITTLHPIRDANVPIIKIVFSGIHIDLLFARLSFKSIDDKLDSLEDDSLLKNCSKECVLSLNGCRVTNTILSLVPNPSSFKLTLRAIKLWAKKRGIYSNSIGYPGGVAWAILVAKICKMFPNLLLNQLLRKFFDVYSSWNWEEPVQITEIKNEVGFSCPVAAWDKEKDGKQCFIILTPAFPCQNTNYNTTETTKKVMLSEFAMFKSYTSKITYPQENESEYTWKNFFKEIEFFSIYSTFLQVDILATNETDFKNWEGFVESRLRFLIKNFEDFPQVQLRPYTNSFKLKDVNFLCCKTYFYGIEFMNPDVLFPGINEDIKKERMVINLKKPVKVFITKIDEKRVNKKEMNLRLRIKKSDELPIEIIQKKKNEIGIVLKKRKFE